MTEQTQPPEADEPARQDTGSAGAMLRAAREQRGMHIAMLAATMKVTPKRLESLEADRLDELPDLAFARALAQSLCRTLKIDPNPILARMPALSQPEGLVHAVNGLNAPYSSTGAPSGESQRWALLRHPVFWATAFVLGAALTIALAPAEWIARINPARWLATTPKATGDAPATANAPRVVTEPVLGTVSGSTSPAPVATPSAVVPSTGAAGGIVGPTQPVPTSTPLVETVHSAPGVPIPTAPMPEGALAAIVVRASAEAWVEVVDAKGRSLIARSVQAGETVNIDGDAPFRVRLGNVTATDLRYKGEPVDIKNRGPNNTARIELK